MMTNFYYLEARYDARQSFYGKAIVRIDETDTDYIKTLLSYEQPIATINAGGEFHLLYEDGSITTGRHLKEFMKQANINPDRFKGRNIYEKAKKAEEATNNDQDWSKVTNEDLTKFFSNLKPITA